MTVPGFVPLADVPDKVWKKPHATATPYGRRGLENPNHYADMDFKPAGGKSLDELTPTAAALQPATWRQYYKSVGWNAVSQRGLLPFRVWQIYQRMVDFVAARDVANYVAAAGILAHYVGDACQPLHTSYLDDGDPFRKPDGTPSDQMLGHGKGFAHGVHVAFEDDMLDAKYDVILKALVKKLGASHGMKLAKNGQEAGFAVLELARRCRKKLPPKSIVDAYGDLVLTGKKSQATAVLWSKFGTRTVDVIADGCRTLAMLWESAWVAGGGDQIAPSKLTAISEIACKGSTKRPTFCLRKPSVRLTRFCELTTAVFSDRPRVSPDRSPTPAVSPSTRCYCRRGQKQKRCAVWRGR